MVGDSSKTAVEIASLGWSTATTLAWRSQGQLRLTVIVKATFTMHADGEMPFAQPVEIHRAEVHHQANPTYTIRFGSDLAPYMSGADVVLTGSAHAPEGTRVQALTTRFAVFRERVLLDKRIYVYGDRSGSGLVPFERMPLRYERAFGGLGMPENPFGTGAEVGSEAPNLIDPVDPRRPACFAPLSENWPARKRLVTRAQLDALRRPIPEMPSDLDWRYFHTAPPDQRIDSLRGDEQLMLEGLHPRSQRLQVRLPGATAAARVFGLGGAEQAETVTMVADTLRVDTDQLQCSIVWRGHLVLPGEQALGAIRVVAGVETPGHPIAWPASPAPSRGAGTRERTQVFPVAPGVDFAGTMDVDPARELESTLPFQPGAAAPPSQPSPSSHAPGPPHEWTGTMDLSATADRRAHEQSSLPFLPPAAAPPAPPTSAQLTGTVELSFEASRHAADRGALPFTPGTSAPLLGGPRAQPPRQFTGTIADDDVSERSRHSAAAFFHHLERPAEGAAPVTAESPLEPRSEDAIPVVTSTPLLAFTLPWEPKPGRPARAVVVKATFDIVPGGPAKLRDEVDPPSGDVHAGDDPGASVLYPSDFAPFKPRVDVTLKGHAGAPAGGARAAVVRFRFGRAGSGFDLVKSPGDTPDSACFGAVSMRGPARWSKLGTYGAAWQRTRWPSFPEDFDWTFFQAAPRSQQLEHVEGDEPFELIGMHPEHHRLEGSLPRLSPRCFARRTDRALEEVVLRIDTVSFDADELKLNLVWRGLVEVADDAATDVVELFLMTEAPGGSRLGLAEVEAKYQVAKTPLALVGEEPDAPAPANQTAPGQVAATAPAPEAPAPPDAPPRRPAHLDPVRARVVEWLARGDALDDADLAGADLSDLDFSGRSLARANFKEARLVRCRFTACDLSAAQLGGADLTDAVLDRANLELADLTGANLDAASFTGANVGAASFARARGARAGFREARGDQTSFAEGTWAGARFDGAALPGADFTGAELDEASFEGAVMPRIKLHGARGQQASFRGARLDAARADGVRLPRGLLQGISAESSVWDAAVLDEATFMGAKLREASFAKASCRSAVFSGADLTEGRLGRTKLAGAALLKANLMGASLEAADLTGADLRGANLHGAETWKAKLKGAQLELAIVTQTKLEEDR